MGLRREMNRSANATIRSIDSAALGALAWRSAERNALRQPLSMLRRHLVEALQVDDPLASATAVLPPIDLVFVAHPRDADLLDLATEYALATSRNPIARTVIIVPDNFVESGALRYPTASVVAESTVIDPATAEHIRHRFGPASGWIFQQVLKFRAVLSSSSTACLIVDADTLLLRPRTWLTEPGVQLLAPSLEYWEPYAVHLARMWPNFDARSPLSWVTHHQLMQKDIVSEMFGAGGEGLDTWIALAEPQQPSPLSEYHSYGAYLFARHRERVGLAQWNNLARPRVDFPTIVAPVVGGTMALRLEGRRPHSISFHHYL
ncbi:MAG: hypothetical protein WCH93_09460 [Actinomycetota bacterium]